MKEGTARALEHMSAREFVSLLKRVRRISNGWIAECPAHDDKSPSLSVTQGDDGRVLLNCFGGCSFEAICEALGIDSRRLGPLVGYSSATKKSEARIVETYDYVAESGALLFQVVRYDPKGFSQRRPTGSGWVSNVKDVRRVLYRLPELLASDSQTTVFIVEGEKDADKLVGLDY